MDLKELRNTKELSQAALAKAIGVSASTISAIEAGRMKISQKIMDKVNEVYGEVIEPTAEAVKEKAVIAEKTVKEKAEKTGKAVKEKADKTGKAVKEKAEKRVEEAEKTIEKAEKKIEEAAGKKTRKRAKVTKKESGIHIQSSMGGSITLAEIVSKVGDVDDIYIRVDENKAYWVKGEETGSVTLWD